MKQERFKCGYPEGIESLIAGRVKYGERFEDVTKQILLMEKKQREQLILLVACDRIYGFFEQRGGVANGPLLEQMVRDLTNGLEITFSSHSVILNLSRLHRGSSVLPGIQDRSRIKFGMTEAKYYYDEMVKTGILEVVEGLGLKNVFCTVWNYINDALF